MSSDPGKGGIVKIVEDSHRMTVEQQLLESYQFKLEQDRGKVFPREWGANLMDELMYLNVLRDLYICCRVSSINDR